MAFSNVVRGNFFGLLLLLLLLEMPSENRNILRAEAANSVEPNKEAGKAVVLVVFVVVGDSDDEEVQAIMCAQTRSTGSKVGIASMTSDCFK